MRHRRVVADRDRALISRFGSGRIAAHRVKARETQIRFNALRIEFDRVIQFRKGFLFLVLRKQNAAHQDVTFDVVLVLLQNFFGQTLSF